MDRLYHAAVERRRQVLADDKAHTDSVIRKLTVIPRGAIKYGNAKAMEMLYYYPKRLKEQHMEHLRDRYDPRREYREYMKEKQLRAFLEPGEIEGLGKRLCFDSQDRKHKELSELAAIVYPPPRGKKLSAEEQAACGARLASQAEHEASRRRLEEKYLWKVEHGVKRTAEELAAVAARLCSGGK
jgi:hypothetical protein